MRGNEQQFQPGLMRQVSWRGNFVTILHSSLPHPDICRFAMLALVMLILLFGSKGVFAGVPATPDIPTIITDQGTNVVLLNRVRDDYLIVDVTPPVHNWWMMKISGVKGKTLTIGVSMAGKGDDSKWTSLQPVYTYADPNQLETYEWFTKEKGGHWRSGNALLADDKRDAGNGSYPIQQAIPQDSAYEFLAADGSYWEPWKRITNTDINNDVNTFNFTQSFTQDTVWVAMRYPFSYQLLQRYIAAIKSNTRDPRITVKRIGESKEKRDLYAIEIASSRFFIKQPGTLLLYTREHGTEPDGGHAIIGVLNAILDGKIDNWPRISLIPMVDPDCADANRFEGMINSFGLLQFTPESTAITNYARTLKADNQHLDTSIGLYNVENNESANLWIPHADTTRWWVIEIIKKHIESNAVKEGYTVSPKVRDMAYQGNRFEGWLADNLFTADLIYELNMQASNAKLTLKRLQEIGPLLVTSVDESQLDDNWLTIFRASSGRNPYEGRNEIPK